VTCKYHRMQKHKYDISCPDLFLWNPYCTHQSTKNSASMLRARRHRNALHDPQIAPDAKTQVRRKVSQRIFCGIRTGPTQERKIVHRHFASRTHGNALHDSQILPEAKTQVRLNVSHHTFFWNLYRSHTSMKNSASTFHAPECTA
jgi:hypothetical protein